MGTSHKVIFTPSGIRAEALPGQTVFDVALAAGVDIQSICGGKGLCKRCQIELSPGEHAKFKLSVDANALSPLTDSETKALEKSLMREGRRLACRAQLCGDAVIEVPSDSRQHQSVISKAGTAIECEPNPAIRLYMCELPKPELDDNPSDAEALMAALRDFGIEARPEHRTLMKLQPILAQNDRQLIAVVRDDQWIIDVWPRDRSDRAL